MSRYNPWPEGGRAKTKTARRGKAHSAAARIGWGYRRDRKRGPAAPLRYLAASGLSRAGLKKYRSARKTKPAVLLSKRVARRRKSGKPRTAYVQRPFLVNARRRGGRKRRLSAYNRFVRSFIRRHGWSRGVMASAARAWRGGRGRRAASNISLPGVVDYNRGRRRGGRRRYARNGAILPYMAFENPRKRRRGSRKRRYARNGAILPYAGFNPRGRRRSYDDNPVAVVTGTLEDAVSLNFWTEHVLPVGTGFIFGQFAGAMVYSLTEKLFGRQEGILGSVQRVGSRLLGAAGVTIIAHLATKAYKPLRRFVQPTKVLVGGLIAAFVGLITEVFGQDTYNKLTGMADFGSMADNLTEELKGRIAASVREEVARAEGGVVGTSAFVTAQDLQTSPQLGPGPRVQGMDAFVTAQDLQTAPQYAVYGSGTGEAPVVSDLNTFQDSMADAMLV